jgi:signal transduction histidine kinase
MFVQYHRRRILLVVVLLFFLVFPLLTICTFIPVDNFHQDLMQQFRADLAQVARAGGAADPRLAAAMMETAEDLARRQELRAENDLRKAEATGGMILLASALLLALTTTVILLRRIVTPLLSLGNQIREIATDPGHDGRIAIEECGEFGETARAFNSHMDLLQEKDRQLFHAQQMELAGLLAGGMAHEFNTVLTSIAGFAEILKKKIPEGSPGCEHIDHILAATKRGSHLTRSLLPFHRRGLIHPEPVEVARLVQEVRETITRIIGSNIVLYSVAPSEPLTVMGDRHYLHQVLLNLVNNARDAMPDGGDLFITVGSADIDDRYAGHYGGKAGKYVVISVTDTGAGMEKSTLDRLFQPFYTTKDVGKGTGLGLTIVFGIVKEHGGFVTVDSVMGKGSDFSIYLPVHEERSAK